MPILFKNIGIYLGPYALKAKANRAEVTFEVDEKDVTTLGDSTQISFPGLFKASAQVDGFMDLGAAADGKVDGILDSLLGASSAVPLTMATAGGATGERAFFMAAHSIKSNPLSGAPGDVHPFSFQLVNGGEPLVRGRIALPEGTISGASGNGTAYQLGAVSATQKLYACVHFIDVSSGGSVVIKVQSDTVGFATPTDRITFTAATGQTSEWKEVAGAITDDYWRVDYARTGGATFSAVVAFGIGPA